MTVEYSFDQDAALEAIEGLTGAVRIAYTASYAVHVEFPTSYTGTRPPFQPLYEWVQRKWNDLDQGLKDAGLSDEVEAGSEEHQKSVTWIVVNAIAANGIEGVFFGRRSVEKGREKADALAARYKDSDNPDAGTMLLQDIGDLMFEHSQRIISEEATDTGTLLQSGQIEFFEDPTEVEADAA